MAVNTEWRWKVVVFHEISRGHPTRPIWDFPLEACRVPSPSRRTQPPGRVAFVCSSILTNRNHVSKKSKRVRRGGVPRMRILPLLHGACQVADGCLARQAPCHVRPREVLLLIRVSHVNVTTSARPVARN